MKELSLKEGESIKIKNPYNYDIKVTKKKNEYNVSVDGENIGKFARLLAGFMKSGETKDTIIVGVSLGTSKTYRVGVKGVELIDETNRLPEVASTLKKIVTLKNEPMFKDFTYLGTSDGFSIFKDNMGKFIAVPTSVKPKNANDYERFNSFCELSCKYYLKNGARLYTEKMRFSDSPNVSAISGALGNVMGADYNFRKAEAKRLIDYNKVEKAFKLECFKKLYNIYGEDLYSRDKKLKVKTTVNGQLYVDTADVERVLKEKEEAEKYKDLRIKLVDKAKAFIAGAVETAGLNVYPVYIGFGDELDQYMYYNMDLYTLEEFNKKFIKKNTAGIVSKRKTIDSIKETFGEEKYTELMNCATSTIASLEDDLAIDKLF